MHKLLILFSTGFYSGYAKIVPGTFGTLAAIPLVVLTNGFSILMKLFIFILLFVGGIVASEYYEKFYDKKDPSEVVIDEIAAYYLLMMFIPVNLYYLLVAFVLFRIFDILKPYPIRQLESIGGGVGIMIDDILASIYSLIVFLIIKGFI